MGGRRKRKALREQKREAADDAMLECDCGEPGGKHTAECALFKPDWTGKCDTCGASPIVPLTGMCGPCTFGEAGTAAGEW